jgi:hypothetical protein
VGGVADAFLARRSLHIKHPVYDFLFTYYPFSPLKLKQWVPALQQTLVLPDDKKENYPWLNNPYFIHKENQVALNSNRFTDSMRGLTQFALTLSENIKERPSRFGCFGLHEWAMVYQLSQEAVRHNGYQLRLSPEVIKQVVDSQSLACTHYDAFRFFTKEAAPKNKFQPDLNSRLEMEQGGCIHANMDLYKWAGKLWPWIGSDFIAKAFLLAVEGRVIDMRASPYDLSKEGFDPICIETEAGRRYYQEAQHHYAFKAATLREEFIVRCRNLLATV